MAQKGRLLDVFEGRRSQKVILAASVIILLVLELMIYLAAASQAGQKSRVVISDTRGAVVYETPGTTLTSYEKLNFENTHGPLKDYRIQIVTESLPFPFRAWSTAAVGIPVGLILIVAFLVRSFLSLVYGEDSDQQEDATVGAGIGKFGSMANLFRRVSIFYIGFLVVLAVLLFWIVPNFLGDLARISTTAIREYKWFFLGVSIFFALLTMWVIYLRYKLSREMLKNQSDLEKYRLEIQLLEYKKEQPLLPVTMNEAPEQ
jgi:hypothetical protein